ncbi:hypothetical protein ACFZ9V_01365 [Acinetobacter baumannii]|uniref:hypothetical protein n=1 Tax=Acinetobacter baumannii TaxID=470 RepID=UPI00192ADCFD|nr:hypothetical protein [Acinetobacter baumannii]EKU0206517.1 hypothetical protein [Acinetobacter baumannii]MDG6194855.1 hypothetical protein [Acinetobacter baumannii]MDK1585363.1 hypothetical protein [Acinetobacter baumannii]MDO5925261.1 hypothetical protein [Acinetobacter baumannii]MDP4328197.1 hypothetical protein [Acinetobacter baumannii]
MVQPYDYTLDIQNPVDTLTNNLWKGFQLGASVDQVKKQREQEELQKQAELQRQEDTRALIQNPTNENFTTFQLMYPAQAETIQKVWERKSQADKDLSWRIGSEALAALSNKNPEIAKEVLNNAATAYENSGKKQDAGSMRFYANLIDKNPENAQTLMQGYLSTVDREKFDKTFEQFNTQNRANEKQPYELNQIAANTAKTVAETNDIPLAAEDRRTGVENQGRKIEYDNQYNYDKLSQDQQQFYDGLDKTERIEAAKLRAAKAESSIQRVERLEKVENYANAAKQAADASNLAARLTQQAKENGGAYWDRLVRQIPGTSENTFAKDIETLKSQVFLAQVEKMRGLGALTDKEGDAIRSSIASLDINQGPEAVQKNLSKIAQQMSAAAKSANRKAQLYATKGDGYSPAVMSAAKTLGISPAEAQKFVNENGL